MLCENCKKNMANTYFKQTINGKTNEIFLCSECAAKLGLADSMPSFGIEDLFFNLMEQPFAIPEVQQKTCPHCGISEKEIFQNGKMGCGNCYETFKGNLSSLINKIHGNKKHIGKIPLSAKGAMEKEEHSVTGLKRRLEEAINAENFEQAAILRDKIKELGKE